MGGSSFEELKRAALEQSQLKRVQLDRDLKERARKKDEEQKAQDERKRQRDTWAARERERQSKRDSLHSHRVALQKQVSERREAAARAAEKAAIEKAAGRRATKRAPALEKARNIAVQHRSQVPRAKPAPTALTREEKRMKRMAKDMGVPFKPMSTRPPKTPSNNSEVMMSSLHKVPTSLQSSASHSSIHAPARRPMTAREKFIEAERLRKEAKNKREEHQDSYEDEDMFEEADYENEDDVLEDNNVGPSHASIRDQIWQLFGRNRQAYMARDIDSDDDMEAGADAVLREEQRSSLYGRREDEREEQLLLEEKRRKHVR